MIFRIDDGGIHAGVSMRNGAADVYIRVDVGALAFG
jgi:hypothetical protein